LEPAVPELLDAGLNRLNRWALKHVGRQWLDYIASNTMTDFNRRWNDFVWTYELKALVLQVKDEAPGVKTVTLMPNQHWRQMTPGQHIGLTAVINGQSVTRSYSLSPMTDDAFSITVKHVPGGPMSGWVHSQLKPGMTVPISQPQGQFRYLQQPKLLFISAGSGITPCYSITQSLLADPARPDIAFYAQFSTAADLIFARTLSQWRSTGLAVHTALSRPNAADTESGQFAPALSAEHIETLVPDFKERDIYLCGPQGFMDKVVGVLRDKGYDLKRLHSERFTAHAAHKLTSSDFKTAQAEIYFQHLDKHIELTEADEGLSLMQIAERHDVHIETGCRQGMCGTCKLTLREGEVSGNTLGNAVYLCTAFPASSKLVLDA
jgi:ferredoxin-NADP reductase